MAGLLVKLALNPALSGSLWFALTAPQTRDQVLEYATKYLSQTSIDRTTATLKWLALLGLLRWANTYFNNLAQNNFRLSSEAHRYDWPNEIAVITGGTGGFGALMSKSLASKGVTVICVDVRDELPETLKSNPKVHYHKVDITSPAAVQQLAKDIRTQHGKDPSILINNAGVAFDHSILTASNDSLKKIFDVNVISHYTLLQAFVPAMIRQKKGHVVSIASMASFISGPEIAPYSGTKAAVLALHEGLQQEVRVFHNAPEVKFTIMHPFYARTALLSPFEEKLKIAGVTVLEPEVVTDAVVKQILSGKGRQIILAGDLDWLAGFRGFPQWLQQIIVRTTDSATRKIHAMTKAKQKQGESEQV